MAQPPPNFDSIARPYRWLEYLSFGPYLERCRFYYLDELRICRHALVLGDGDGRFTASLLAARPRITVDAIDASAVMLRLLSQRVARLGPSARDRLQIRQMNALDFEPEHEPYDLVVTHFFLDCFSQRDVDALVARVAQHLIPGAVWLVSEFAIPERLLAGFLSSVVVGTLYRIFGMLTGLKVRILPDYRRLLSKAGFELRAHKDHLGGLLRSELWFLAADS